MGPEETTGRCPDRHRGQSRGNCGYRRLRRRRLFAAATLLSLVLAATSHAQIADVQNQAGETTGVDSDLTPVATPSNLWEQVGGSFFRSGGKIDDLTHDSATSYDEDLFAVGFRDLVTPGEDYGKDEVAIRAQEQGEGFAGGARCIREDPSQPVDPAEVESCERVPVIYRYPEQEGIDRWAESHVSPNSRSGYVGAVAWIDESRAIAVGGDGRYPRREHERRVGESYEDWVKRDQAGKARAWLYEDGAWRELANKPDPEDGFTGADGDEIPDAMRGLSAVDCSPRETGFCAAGSLGQIWHFEEQAFNPEPVTEDEVETEDASSPQFLFRVRDLAFAPGDETPPSGDAAAVTAGCCADVAPSGLRAELVYRDGDWTVTAGADPTNAGPISFQGAGWPVRSVAADSIVAVAPGFDSDSINRDAVYAATDWSHVLAPGGPNAETNGGSWVVPEGGEGDYDPGEIPAHLVSGDGDYLGYCTSAWPGNSDPCPHRAGAGHYYGPNGVLDWATGELRSGQAASYTTAPFKDRFEVRDPPGPAAVPQPRPETDDPDSYRERLKNKQLFKLSSYALNSLDVIAPHRGWAVGDHGALVRLGSARGSGAEPDPPKLGSSKAAELSDRSSYEGVAPKPAGETGAVPALAGQETERLAEPRLVSYGTASHDRQIPEDKVNAIVMSRDGSEGWALGGEAGAYDGQGSLILHRWDGQAWKRCETDGIRGEVAPDAACEDLAPLRHYQPNTNGNERPVRITAATRIPLEYDNDPTNDDEFEAIAVGTAYKLAPGGDELPTVIRYRKGEWSIDKDAMHQIGSAFGMDPDDLTDIAFTAPHDGWLTDTDGHLWHYAAKEGDPDEGKWVQCARPGMAECDDGEGRAPVTQAGSPNGQVEQSGIETRGIRLDTAGERVYMYATRGYVNDELEDVPFGSTVGGVLQTEGGADPYPMILYRDPGGQWTSKEGGYDPGFDEPERDPEKRGRVGSLDVAQRPDGSFVGWATGAFGNPPPRSESPVGGTSTEPPAGVQGRVAEARGEEEPAAALRLEDKKWSAWRGGDAVDDNRVDHFDTRYPDPEELSLFPGPGGEPEALITPTPLHASPRGFPLLRFTEEGRWSSMPAPFFASPYSSLANGMIGAGRGTVTATAPDGQGGLWLAVQGTAGCSPGCTLDHDETTFYRYTDRAPKPLFEDAPHPIRERMTAASAGPDGSFWIATASNRIYRHDRVGGWERVAVPGWQKGRVQTVGREVRDIAIGPDGTGVAVGEQGRIVNLSPSKLGLDAAAGTSCSKGDPPPCSTSRDLEAVAVAPDGSALAGGQARSLLYRPAGGEFAAASTPAIGPNEKITAISMPAPGRAWLVTASAEIHAGTLTGGGDWSWRRESASREGLLPSQNDSSVSVPLSVRDIALDASGHGYAVGDQGLVLERTSAGEWKRRETGQLADLTAVALPTGGGEGVLIGGEYGLMLTLVDGYFQVAHHVDRFHPLQLAASGTADVVGLALLPGTADGESEEWAAVQGPAGDDRTPPGRILHHASDPENALLDSAGRAQPLPDVPAPDPSELSLAAFGRQECHLPQGLSCTEPTGSNLTADSVAKRIVEELRGDGAEPGGVDLSLFTGDATDAAGTPKGGSTTVLVKNEATPVDSSAKHRRWTELVPDRLAAAGLPTLGAIGPNDLSQAQFCPGGHLQCVSSREQTTSNNHTHGEGATAQGGASGLNLPWREAMARMAAPWGQGDEYESGELSFEAVRDPGTAEAPGGGARTHYAVDISRDGEEIARLVVLDSAFRSLTASDPHQNPVEATGQLEWLDRMTCLKGSATNTGSCSRDPDQKAIVLTNTPSYSYGPGAGTDTQTESAAFEAILHKNSVDVVVSGRLGWNGLYYSQAPGVHTPEAGGEHPSAPPEPLPGQGKPIPHVIASGGGGEFGPDGQAQGDGSEGFWRGYSKVRIPEQGAVIVEQRPVFDWISLTARDHTVRPRRRLPLDGQGRAVSGTETPVRYEQIDSHAITHRYDLLLADQERPWLPLTDADAQAKADEVEADEAEPQGPVAQPDGPEACGHYVCLDEKIGEVDPTTGVVKSGGGNHPPTFALALLSVGEKAASWPLLFEPSPSFRTNPPIVPRPSFGGASVAAPASPTAPSLPQVPNVSTPQIPTPPALVPPPPAPPATPPQPPVPPPVPPADAGPSPLSLSFAPTGLVVAPTASVIPPPAPPINPAPPGGARREARQRQAATQKSGADSQADSGASDGAGDLAKSPESPTGSEMTRRDASRPARQDYSFTRLERADSGSPAVLWGGGMMLAALALALTFTTLRPGSRRRGPEVPAPALVRWPSRSR